MGRDIGASPWPPRSLAAGFALATALAALLAGCGSPRPATPRQEFSGAPYTLRTLGSDELSDMPTILKQAAKATGVTVALTPTTTLAGTRAVASGQADGKYDATWFATNRYLTMRPGALARISGASEIMSSPVIVGVRASVARRLGWDAKPVSWSDIAAAAAAHKFSFGMSDPANSNSGLSALVSVATAAAGDGAALQPSEIARATPRLREFFSGQSLKASSSTALVGDYVRAQNGDTRGPAADGIIDYESVLLSLNASGKLRQPLKLIYPSDGVVTADYTFSLLASASPAARSAYNRLVGYLLTPRVQRQIMQQTRRRPAIPGIRIDASFGRHQLFQVPFPATTGILSDLISAYNGTLRCPARTVYVLDISQPMAGPSLGRLKAVLSQLTGADDPDSQEMTLHDSDQVTLLPFSTAPYPQQTLDIPARDPQPALNLIRAITASLAAGGSSAIYDALTAAYQTMARQDAASPGRISTIILLTDGTSNTGQNMAAFARFYHHLPPAIASVPVFPVLLGGAGAAQMQKLAALTGGQVLNARHLPLTSTALSLIKEGQ